MIHRPHLPPPATGTANDRSAVPPDKGNAGKHVDTPSPYAHLEEGWRFKVPADKNATLTVGKDTLYWCGHCKFHKTFKVRLYNKTHSTSNHGGLKRGDMTKAEQDASYLVDPNLKSEKSAAPHAGPAAKLSPVLEPAAPVDTSNSTHVNTDPDGLEFSESAFLAEVLDDGDYGVWMAALKFTKMPKMSPRTKHIAIPYHFFRSKIDKEIQVVAINTENQLADQFTKGLPQDKFLKLENY